MSGIHSADFPTAPSPLLTGKYLSSAIQAPPSDKYAYGIPPAPHDRYPPPYPAPHAPPIPVRRPQPPAR